MGLLFSLLIIPAGAMQFFQSGLIRPVYFPIISFFVSLFSLRLVLAALSLFSVQMLLLLVRWPKTPGVFLEMTDPGEAAALVLSLFLTAVISSAVIRRLRTEKEKSETLLSRIAKNAREISRETAMDSLSTEDTLSHYFSSMLKTDEEIGELLVAIKHAVFADSASLFVPEEGGFVLRCSTEKKGEIIISGDGVIAACMRDKKAFSSGEIDDKKLSLGYVRKLKVVSAIAAPIMEGSALIGILAVDSSRAHAFSEPEKNTVGRFAGQLVRILERERIYFMIKRDVFGLRILREESSNLITSLNRGIIARKLCEGAGKIAASQVYFFIGSGGEYDLVYHNSDLQTDQKRFSFEKTVINFAIENRHRHYVRDLKDYQIRILPFRTEAARSVLAIPMIYERTVLGILVMLSENVDFADALQISLLEVLCNQASMSLANALLHSKIETLATTDGLTGLYNHRVFQEKFSEELKRHGRMSGPVSLMLTDIDFFKKINDSYGHPVGDIVLRGVSAILRETLRDTDIPARYGGEEFAVILPGTDGHGAKIMAERLRTAVMEKVFNPEGRAFSVTISIGIAVCPADAKTKEELIEKADQALYGAKHGGRNRSVLWSAMA
ncbi:MAG: diguanylate cyclase [Nitrospirae bacterium]|nr:diguanylate cyclase [Nitrospirota bacterium]